MTTSDVWLAALRIIADYSPMTWWQTSNGAVFWMTLTSRNQLDEDCFSETPFSYAEIVSVCVVSEVRFRQEVLSRDWPALKQKLLSVPGLSVEERRDLTIPPASPPNEALRLTVSPGDF
jgi:hypothetical protein